MTIAQCAVNLFSAPRVVDMIPALSLGVIYVIIYIRILYMYMYQK